MKEQVKSVSTAALQEQGGARVQLQPRRPGEALKTAEVILKKRTGDLAEKAARAKKIRKLKRHKKNDCHQREVKSAQHFVKRALLLKKDIKRVAFTKKTPTRRPRMQKQRPLLLVVRNSREGGSREVRDLLKRLGLGQAYTATLLRNDEQAQEHVRILRPFVFYGFPTYQTLRRLFLTRQGSTYKICDAGARLRLSDGRETAELTDNLTVEKSLGHLGVLCVEDLLYEIWNRGPHFDEIKEHLCSFQLSNLKKAEGLDAKRNEYGDLKDKINEKIWKIA